MKKLLTILCLVLLSSCSETNKEQKKILLTLDCRISTPISGYKERIQFLWYDFNNTLQAKELDFGMVTPFKSEDDWELIFERGIGASDTPRTVTFNKITQELNITHPPESVFRERNYICNIK